MQSQNERRRAVARARRVDASTRRSARSRRARRERVDARGRVAERVVERARGVERALALERARRIVARGILARELHAQDARDVVARVDRVAVVARAAREDVLDARRRARERGRRGHSRVAH